MSIKYPWVALLLSFLTLVSQITRAENAQPSSWSIKGFGTLAATRTDNGRIGFYRDKSQTQDATDNWGLTTDSRLGLQIDWRAAENIQATAQWVARDHIGDFADQNLDLAFLRWRIRDDLTLRGGRLPIDMFMLAEYRNVSYAYPWMRPPHEFYSGLPFYHFDGGDLTKKLTLTEGDITIKLFGGQSFNQILIGDYLDDANMDFSLTGISLRYENMDWRLHTGYAYLKPLSELPIDSIINLAKNPLVQQIWPGIDQFISLVPVKNKEFHYTSVGVAYDNGIWLSQAEAAYTHSNSPWYPSQTQAYLSLARRFSTFTFYSLLGIAKTLHDDIDIPKPLIKNHDFTYYQKRADSFINHNGLNEKSISFGVRWDFTDKVALKAQFSHYWLNNRTPQQWQQWQQLDSSEPQTVNLLSVGVDFVF